jgi:hypothetical protein
MDQILQPVAEDFARAERVLWRAERLTRSEAEAINAAYSPEPSEPTEFQAVVAMAQGLVADFHFEYDAAELGERIDDIAVWACGTYGGMVDFIHNIDPEATVIGAIHHAWTVALLGDRLADEERDILTIAWRAVAPEPAPGWFGPRTAEVEAFLAAARKITPDQAAGLARRWTPGADRDLAQILSAIPSIRDRWYSYAGHLAAESAARALFGRMKDFTRVPIGDPRRHASYLVGWAAEAECVRDAVPPELIARLEGPWRDVIGSDPIGA